MISTDHSDEAKCCYEHAQQCAEWASQAHDIETRNTFLSLETKWRAVAETYVGVEKVRDSIAKDAFLRLDAMWRELAARRSGESNVNYRQSALFEILERRPAVQARSKPDCQEPDASRWAMIRNPYGWLNSGSRNVLQYLTRYAWQLGNVHRD
jgi:hypothetical protein